MIDAGASPSASEQKDNTAAFETKDFEGTSFLLYRVELFDWLMI